MSFVTAVPETLVAIHGEYGPSVTDATFYQKICCALGATPDSAGMQDGFIRDVTNCRTGISHPENMR